MVRAERKERKWVLHGLALVSEPQRIEEPIETSHRRPKSHKTSAIFPILTAFASHP